MIPVAPEAWPTIVLLTAAVALLAIFGGAPEA
jgi:hypothetical protein